MLFARLRDIAGAAEIPREVSTGATIATVWRELADEFPELSPYERSMSSALIAHYLLIDSEVPAGDEIAFLPPVSVG
jgi:molybdopterin converting factor small subunit